MEEIPDKRFFRPDEVAEILRVSVRTIRRWAAKDLVKFVRTPGGEIRIPNKEIARLLAVDTRKYESNVSPGIN